jgi:hypothetical protein
MAAPPRSPEAKQRGNPWFVLTAQLRFLTELALTVLLFLTDLVLTVLTRFKRTTVSYWPRVLYYYFLLSPFLTVLNSLLLYYYFLLSLFLPY